MSDSAKKLISDANSGRILSIETRIKISKNHADFTGSKHPLYGVRYDWINNGVVNKRLNKGETLPAGFNYGRTKLKKI